MDPNLNTGEWHAFYKEAYELLLIWFLSFVHFVKSSPGYAILCAFAFLALFKKWETPHDQCKKGKRHPHCLHEKDLWE